MLVITRTYTALNLVGPYELAVRREEAPAATEPFRVQLYFSGEDAEVMQRHDLYKGTRDDCVSLFNNLILAIEDKCVVYRLSEWEMSIQEEEEDKATEA